MNKFKEISPQSAWEMITTQHAILVDIRQEKDFLQSHPQGAIHLNSDNIAHNLSQWHPDQPIIVSCYHGISSQKIAHYLITQGFQQIYNLRGGMAEWKKAQLPTE